MNTLERLIFWFDILSTIAIVILIVQVFGGT